MKCIKPLNMLLFHTLILFSSRAVLGKSTTFERVVTNYLDVLDGVPIDYRYNQSSTNHDRSSPGSVPSVPGCPKSDEGYPWVYYGKPPKCYLAGTQGPCDSGGRLFVEEGSAYGYCNCNCFEGGEVNSKSTSNAIFCDDSDGYSEFAFLRAEKRCYELYSQGPCKPGEWIAKINSGGILEARCETRRCSEWEILNKTTNRCVPLPPPGAGFGPSPVLPNLCAEKGQKYSTLLKRCIATFKFTFI